jgi:hypothetical protein
MTFDARKEARTFEDLAKNRIDTTDGLNANMALAKEWANLSQSERNITGQALMHDYSNHNWDGLPKPVINLDADGNCNSIDFKASNLDFHKGPKHVKVSNDGDVAIWVSAD